MTITWKGAHSNNYTPGRAGKPITEIILHWIVGTLQSADATFANPTRQASAHYGIGKTAIHQYVHEADTAWHAGNFDVNQRSIGIEHQGGPDLPIDELTYKTSAKLVAAIAKRHNIPLDRTHVRGHREIKATQCPGTLDIDRIIRDAKAINGGGDGQMTDELKACLADREKFWRERDEAYKEIETHKGTIKNLNDSLTSKRDEISKLKAQRDTLTIERDEAIKQRDATQELADKATALEIENKELIESRAKAYEETEAVIEAAKLREAALQAEIKHLEDDALHALIRKIMRSVRGGDR